MRVLTALLPWMVVGAALARDLPEPIQFAVTHHGTLPTVAFRIGDEVLVPVDALRGVGWQVQQGRSDVEIRTESRTARIPFRTQAGQTVVPMRAVARQLDAELLLDTAARRATLLAKARNIEFKDGWLNLESSLPVQPVYSVLTNPPRTAIDFRGLHLAPSDARSFGEARVAQLTPDTVRVILPGTLARPAAPEMTAARRLRLRLTSASVAAAEPARPTITQDSPPEPLRNAQPPATPATAGTPVAAASPAPPVPAEPPFDPTLFAPETTDPVDLVTGQPTGPAPTPVGPLNLVQAGAARSTLRLRLGSPLGRPPIFQRPEPRILDVVLANVRWAGEFPSAMKIPGVQSVEQVMDPGGIRLRFRMERPMGVVLSTTAGAIEIALIRPQVGDGKLAGKTVVLDPGHGGPDSGARSLDRRVMEKTLVLAISRLTAERLTAEGATVIMTRDSDVGIPLRERAEIANRNGAHFFLSVHINSNRRPNSVSGSITFYHQRDPIGQLLAECIEREIARVSKLPSLGAWSDRRIYDTGFAVLRHSRMPAVLLELGFINHRTDVRRLQEKDYQEAVARAIVRGLKEFLGDESSQNE